MSKKELAVAEFKRCGNCAEAVLAAFQQEIRLDPEVLIKISAGFEKGMFSNDTCGAVAGAIMVLGMQHKNLNERCKRKVSRHVREFRREFAQRHGSTTCKDLKKIFARTCPILVGDAAEIVETLL